MRQSHIDQGRQQSRAWFGQTDREGYRRTIRRSGLYVERGRSEGFTFLERIQSGKEMSVGIVAMLTRLVWRFDPHHYRVRESGPGLIKSLDLAQHAADVGVIVARFEDSIAFPGIAPFEDLNRDAPNAPLIHLRRRWAIQINRIAA